MKSLLLLFFFFAFLSFLSAEDILTQYELLTPESHRFAIRYDVSATEPGSSVYFNIIRPGSEASDEKVLDRASGKEIPFEMSTGKEAKAAKQAEEDTEDHTPFIKVKLPRPVPAGAALSTNFAFGGSNAVAVFRSAESGLPKAAA